MKYLLCLTFALTTLLASAQTPKATSLLAGADINSTQDFGALMKADGYAFVAEKNPQALVLYAYNYWPVVGNDTLVGGKNKVQHLVSLGNVMHIENVFITSEEALYTKVLNEFVAEGFKKAADKFEGNSHTTRYTSAKYNDYVVEVSSTVTQGAANNTFIEYMFTVSK